MITCTLTHLALLLPLSSSPQINSKCRHWNAHCSFTFDCLATSTCCYQMLVKLHLFDLFLNEWRINFGFVIVCKIIAVQLFNLVASPAQMPKWYIFSNLHSMWKDEGHENSRWCCYFGMMLSFTETLSLLFWVDLRLLIVNLTFTTYSCTLPEKIRCT